MQIFEVGQAQCQVYINMKKKLSNSFLPEMSNDKETNVTHMLLDDAPFPATTGQCNHKTTRR
jgi:hypothetical protein